MTSTKQPSAGLLALRIITYIACVIFGAGIGFYMGNTWDWAANPGTAEYAHYTFCFNAFWIDLWLTLGTLAITLIIWAGSRIVYNSLPATDEDKQGWHERWWLRYQKWEQYVTISRRIFACFALICLSAMFTAAAPASPAPPAGIGLFLVALYFLNRKN